MGYIFTSSYETFPMEKFSEFIDGMPGFYLNEVLDDDFSEFHTHFYVKHGKIYSINREGDNKWISGT